MSKNNILIVNKYFYPDIGGVETVVKQYAEWLIEYETNSLVILCCSKRLSFKSTSDSFGKAKLLRCSSFGSFFGMPISFSFIYYFIRYASLSNVINIHYPFPLADISVLLLGKNKKIIYTVHAQITGKGIIGEIAKKIALHALLKSKYIVYTSETLKGHFKIGSYIKQLVIPLCLTVSPTIYEKSSTIAKKLPSRFSLFFGRLAWYKGLEVLIEAAHIRKSKNIPIIIAGDGNISKNLRSRISDALTSANMVFLNQKFSEEEKYSLLSQCDFLIFPSTTQAEAFGIIQLEALSLGIPVINTYLGTGVEWVSLNNVTGLTVFPNNSHELAVAIDKLTYSLELRDNFSVAALSRSRMFNSKDIKNQVITLFNAVLND